jgi:AAA family ATP:ADP antiporter
VIPPVRKGYPERFLSIFADIHKDEGLTAFLLMLNVFILLTAYYIIKPVRESLILGGSGAEMKSYAGAVQALLFMLIVPLYASIARRVNRVRLINAVTGFFVSNLAVFYLLGRMGVRIGVPFFLWVGLFNVMLVAQFWAFANDIYTQEQGRRLFAIVGIGSSTGAIFGAAIAGRLFDPIGAYPMMLVAGALLGLSLILTNWIHIRERRGGSAEARVSARYAERPIGGNGAFQLVFKQRYLLLIAVLVLLSNLVNTTGEFILGKAVKEHAMQVVGAANGQGLTQEQYIGDFYANFFFWVNVVGATLQLFVVSRVMKYVGIGAALFILPVIALGSYTLLAFAPILNLVRLAKIAENSTDYSIQNTARHALFLRTSRAAKYKAKAAIDSFFWRAGDGLSALLVFVGTQLRFGLSRFAMINAVLVLIWLFTAAGIMRFRKSREQAARAAAA